MLALVLVLFICFMERAQRRVLIQYPKRQTARGQIQQERSHLPLKVNTSGVIPPIFASSLLLMPLTIAQFAGNRVAGRERAGATSSSPSPRYLQHGAPLYMFLYGAGIVFFCFFYTAVVFNPEETAENLKKYGGFIPGIRPGKRTEEYLDYVLTRDHRGRRRLSDRDLPDARIPDRARRHPLLSRRHLPADRRQRDDGHGDPDPEPPHRPPIWRPHQEGEAEGRRRGG